MAPIYKIILSPPAAAIVNDDTVVLLWGPFIFGNEHSARRDKELLTQDTLHMVSKPILIIIILNLSQCCFR